MITIAIDAMGGDFGLKTTIPGVKYFLEKHHDVKIILVGDYKLIVQELRKSNNAKIIKSGRVSICRSTQVVEMDENPLSALKYKKDSSLRKAVNLVKIGRAQAVVSAGNTGAIVAISKFVLKTINGISRPAIARFIPTKNDKVVCALDLGANIDSPPENLLQFAILGSKLVEALYSNKSPKIALLNIGEEEIKGTDTVKEAYKLLSNSSLNFVGNIEANHIFSGEVDVIVSDGFVGNIALKTLEGTAKFGAYVLKDIVKKSIIMKFLLLLSFPLFLKIKKVLDPSRYNGAIILGLKGIVVKSHGAADAKSFYYAILEAYQEAKNSLLDSLEKEVLEELEAMDKAKRESSFIRKSIKKLLN